MILITKTQNFTSIFVGELFFMIFVVVPASPSSIYFCIFQHCIVIAIDFVSAHSTFPLEKLNESLLLFNLTAAEKKSPFESGTNAVVEFNAVFFCRTDTEGNLGYCSIERFFYSLRSERDCQRGLCIATVMVHSDMLQQINVCNCVDPLKNLARLPSPIHQMQHVQ